MKTLPTNEILNVAGGMGPITFPALGTLVAIAAGGVTLAFIAGAASIYGYQYLTSYKKGEQSTRDSRQLQA